MVRPLHERNGKLCALAVLVLDRVRLVAHHLHRAPRNSKSAHQLEQNTQGWYKYVDSGVLRGAPS